MRTFAVQFQVSTAFGDEGCAGNKPAPPLIHSAALESLTLNHKLHEYMDSEGGGS
jgi:hypothetical protein